MKDKISIISSFKGSNERVPIYTENYKSIFKSLPKDVNAFICDSSDAGLVEYNEKLLKESFEGGDMFYSCNPLTLLESWIYLLSKINTPYVLAVFDDQYLHNIERDTIQNCIEFLDQEEVDMIFFLRYDSSINSDEKTLSVVNSHMDGINKFKKKEVEINGQNFCVVDNNNAQFKYSFSMNNGIFRKDLLIKQLEFFSSKFSGVRAAHNSEMNHAMCPNEIRNNNIGVCMSGPIFDLDLDFSHIIGIRGVEESSRWNYEAVKNNYKIKTV